MENLFKKKLQDLRHPLPPKTFRHALLGPVTWGQPQQDAQIPSPIMFSEGSEQKLVIEALERFTEEKGTISVDGGEIALRLKKVTSISELKAHLSLESQTQDLILNDKNPTTLKAIFVTEVVRPWSEFSSELKTGFVNELIACFPIKTAEFFERMMMAMKFTSDEILIYPIEEKGQDLSQEVMALAAFFKPEVIITLGAKASQKILNGNDRLSLIHGQFFQKEVEGVGSFQVVPLFHPTIIETNQNMKKTAWADMQKIMKHLKKLS